MGLFGGKKKAQPQDDSMETTPSKPVQKSRESNQAADTGSAESTSKVEDEILAEVLDGGAKKKKKKEKKLELTTSVFEFGSAGGNKGLTLAGFCPISDDHEPCKWEVIEDGGPEQPAIRIIF